MIKDKILKIVENAHKGTELFTNEDLVLHHEFDEISRALEELVADGKLVDVEYVLPNMDYRIKSIYFPKGTEIVVAKARSSS